MDRTTRRHAFGTLQHSLSALSPFLSHPDVQEVMVNAPNDVWIEERGAMHRVECPISEIALESAISLMARLDHKEAKPGTADGIVDMPLESEHGFFRVAAVLRPTALNGHAMAIRKHSALNLSLDDFARNGAFNHLRGSEVAQAAAAARPSDETIAKGGAGLAAYFKWLIAARKNLIVAGGTTSGKTTFLKALVAAIDPRERVVTIEDTPEIKVRVPNYVSFETNEQAQVTTRHLVRLALRFRPTRIIVGEVRGGEAFDLMQAANTGHDGSLATLHANSAVAALIRLETLVLTADTGWPHEAVRQQIAGTFNAVAFLAPKPNGERAIKEVVEIGGYDGRNGQYQVKPVFSRSSIGESHENRSVEEELCLAH